MAPVTLSWDLTTPAARELVWAVLSDTDAFNRAAELGYKFEERPQPDGTLLRVGKLQKFGMELSWEELPWQYEAPRYFKVERRFFAGAAEKVEATMRLDRIATGTRVRYDVAVTPRGLLGRPLVAIDAQLTTRPQLDKALKAALKLAEAGSGFEDRPPMLPPATIGRLEATLADLKPAGVSRGLRDVLLRAPLVDQDRIRPVAAAPSWHVTPETAVVGCLQAVRAGVLEMRFDLLCPSCRGAKASSTTLPDAPTIVHCGTCNIDYDGSFPDSVEVVFRPAGWVRDGAVPTDCLASPARTPHIVAQLVLGPERETELAPTLNVGSYRLHTRGATASAVIEVVAKGPRSVTVTLQPDGVHPPTLRVGAGEVAIAIRSRLPGVALIVIEERWRPPGSLTAAELIAMQPARDLLPGPVLRPRTTIELFPAAVLATEADVAETLAKYLPRVLHVANQHVIGVWDDFAGALAAARGIVSPRVGVGLDYGVVTKIGGAPGGVGVGGALWAMRNSGNGRVVMPSARVADPAVAPALVGVPIDDSVAGVAILGVRPASPERSRAPDPSLVAGKYRVGELLGEGGFARVMAGKDLAGRDVAIKLLSPELGLNPEVAQRFFDEARIVLQLSGSHVARVLDYGDVDDRLYIVMERLYGRGLDQRSGNLTPEQVRAIALDVLDAVAEAHGKGIVHRDLKPDNVFLCKYEGRDDFVKVIDFGIAARAGEVPSGDLALGTPRYMSPEQLDDLAIDGRADLYAVGLVMYEALCGRLPWDGDGGQGEVFRRLTVAPAPPAIEVPAGLWAVILRALARHRDDRWQTAGDMRDALLALTPR